MPALERPVEGAEFAELLAGTVEREDPDVIGDRNGLAQPQDQGRRFGAQKDDAGCRLLHLGERHLADSVWHFDADVDGLKCDARRDGAPHSVQPSGFEQLGWQVSLVRLSEGFVAATREQAPAVSLRIRLDDKPR